MDEPKRRSLGLGTTKHKVEYRFPLENGKTGKVAQEMTQAALADLLTKPGITLTSVNREPAVFYGRN